MSAIVGILQGIAAFLVGILARIGVVVLLVAVLLLPALLALGVARLWRALRPRLSGLQRAGHVLYKPGLRYAAGHTWISREGARARVGLDGVAQEILPWALGVRLPTPGQRVVEGEVAAVVSCGSVDARIAAPLTGKVVAVNAEVERDPSLVKEDGYGRGWLFMVEPDDARWATLPGGGPARDWLAAESERLDRFLEANLGFAGLAARSGPVPPAFDQRTWADLTTAFLHA
jgi:glycine cleavage system H lipoate-binding protein